MTLTSSTKNHPEKPEKIHVVGVNGAGAIVAAACALSGDAVSSVAVDTAGFRFGKITEIRDVNLLPGAVKYGDVPALLALCAPTKLAVAGETAESTPVAAASFKAASGSIKYLPGAEAIVDWLLA
jgi:hypothetical protein